MTKKQADILHVYNKIGVRNKTYIAKVLGVSLTHVKTTIKNQHSIIPTPPKAERRDVRRCLRCDRLFNSTGKENRICPRHSGGQYE